MPPPCPATKGFWPRSLEKKFTFLALMVSQTFCFGAWNLMEGHGTFAEPRSIAHPYTPWNPMEGHGRSWNIRGSEVHRTPVPPVEPHGSSWNIRSEPSQAAHQYPPVRPHRKKIPGLPHKIIKKIIKSIRSRRPKVVSKF
jgi:hypothetical protein